MRFIRNRGGVGRLAMLSVLAWLGTATWAPSVNATSTLFNNNCSGCHGSTSGVAPYPTSTCAGCHAHGTHPTSSKNTMNVSATPDSTSYNPGDPMTVSVTGGYRSGWVRAQMWDLNCSAGGTCNQGNALVSESLYTSGTTVTFPGPVTLNASAPSTPGTYTWYAGWYGNEYDINNAAFGLWIPDGTNSGHGNELVAFTFTVNQATLPETICDDGVDNNNNGLTDCADPDCDGFVGDATACGIGACAAAGNLVCVTPDQVDTCTPGDPTTESVPAGTCQDGIDNDCDGLTDFPDDPDCVYPPEDICNDGIDNDFDGNIDCADLDCDNFVYGTTACGVGACAAEGQEVCQTPDIVDTCTPGTPTAETQAAGTCNDGIDNDCNGLTDANDPSCIEPEVCDDGIDNNLNGLTDCEDPQCDGQTYGACDTGNPGVCAAGTLTCDGSAVAPVCVQDQTAGTEGPFTDPTCSDGLDNDCNGLTDDLDPNCQIGPEICDNNVDDNNNGLVDCADVDFCEGYVGQPGSCDTGLSGVCAAGTTSCTGGQKFCTQDVEAGTEGPFTSPTCSDGLDNDCDGLTDAADPDCTVPLEICDNQVDDNANGLTDCEDPQCADVTFGACDTGNLGICAAGTLSCDGSQPGPVCTQDQTAQPEMYGTPSCSDGLDNDCDGLTDAADPDCEPPPVEICDDGIDNTGNGLIDCQDPECDQVTFGACDTGEPGICAAGTLTCDGSAVAPVCVQDQTAGAEGPYTSPTCQDGLDNDCDGLTDADDPDCAAPVADVYLSRLQAPNKLNVKQGQVVSRKATVRGDGTLLTQDATVTLTGTASAGLGVVVTPASVTEQVVPGNPETRFGFTVSVSCTAAGTGTVDWTATISAPGNDDPSNDVLTGTTSVTCR